MRPTTVVSVVRITGRKRCAAVRSAASSAEKPLASKALISVNQDDIIIHHNSGQGDDACQHQNHRNIGVERKP